jgi:2-methylisocitrate lyase-like PEP mutase family enzyme
LPVNCFEGGGMNKKAMQRKAESLLSLHSAGKLLILPNIWDPIGARILESKDYPAVATASAAISASLGYEDGEQIMRSTLIETLSRIVRSVDVPVTADIESGYGTTLTNLGKTIEEVMHVGIVGINIEDSIEEGEALRSMEAQCKRIAKVREVANRHGVHLVINARTDCFLSKSYTTNEARIEEAVVRAKAYRESGADCIYPVGPGDRETVIELRRRISGPINILATPNAAPLRVLEDIGVNRVSCGPYVFRSCLKKFADIATALQNLQGYECFSGNTMSKADVHEYLIHEPE